MVDDPVGLPLEKRTAGVYVHRLVLHDALVALLGVLASGVEEEAAADGLSDPVEVAPAAHDVQLVSVEEE